MKIMWKACVTLFQSIWKYQKKLFIKLSVIWVSGVLAPLLQVMFPSILLYLLQTSQDLKNILGWILLFSLAIAILYSMYQYMMMEYDPDMYLVKSILTLDLFEKAMRIPYAKMEDMEYRRLLNRAQMNGISHNGVGFECFLKQGLLLLIACSGCFIYMMAFGQVEIWLAILLLVLSILSLWWMNVAQTYEHQRKDAYAKSDQQLQYYHHEVKLPKNGKDIRIFQLQEFLLQKIAQYQTKRVDDQILVEKKYRMAKWGSACLQFIRNIIVYGYFVMQLLDGMSVASFVFYLGAMHAFSSRMDEIVQYYNECKRGALGIIDYLTYMEIPLEEEQAKLDFPKGDIEIRFDHVSYRYPEANKDTIHDVSFTIHAKEKIGIVGSNGAGKTTLMKLLCGFYAPTSGHIYINDMDMKDLQKTQVFTQIAAIFQDSCPMAYSVLKNVSCQKKKDSDLSLVKACLQKSGLDQKVASLIHQEETYVSNIISDDGVMLSGGEQQKLLMARALYQKAKLLILDEPSAALDAIAEANLYETYHEASTTCTSVFISHRLASTRFADRIFLFDQGKLVEEGSHKKLLKQQGLYTEMFEAQASYYQKRGE